MIHPHTELSFVSPQVGWGVFATRSIPRGTITWVLDSRDRRLDAAEVSALTPEEFRCCYQDGEGLWVLAADHGRSVNHSCDPNCVSGGEDGFEIAIRDIRAGEQLTDDYGELQGYPPFDCGCKSSLCRKTIAPAATSSLLPRYRRRQSLNALSLAPTVGQPLLDLLPNTEGMGALVARLMGSEASQRH